MRFSKLVHVLSGNVLVVGHLHDCQAGLEALVAFGEREDKFEIVKFEDPALRAMYQLLAQFRQDREKAKEIRQAIKDRFVHIKGHKMPAKVATEEQFKTLPIAIREVLCASAGIGKSASVSVGHKCTCDIRDMMSAGCKCGGV